MKKKLPAERERTYIVKVEKRTSTSRSREPASTKQGVYNEEDCLEPPKNLIVGQHTIPSSGKNSEPEDENGLLCNNDNRGCCIIHGCTMKKFSVNTRKWGAKGDNDIGWIYKKITKYSCQAKINARLSLAKKS